MAALSEHVLELCTSFQYWQRNKWCFRLLVLTQHLHEYLTVQNEHSLPPFICTIISNAKISKELVQESRLKVRESGGWFPFMGPAVEERGFEHRGKGCQLRLTFNSKSYQRLHPRLRLRCSRYNAFHYFIFIPWGLTQYLLRVLVQSGPEWFFQTKYLYHFSALL